MSSTETKRYPGQVDEAYPDVFNINAMPPQPQPTERKPGQLPEEQIRHFFEKGYLIIGSFFDKAKLEACREAVAQIVDEVAQMLYEGGKITNLYKEYGVFQRLTKMEEEFPGTIIIMMKQNKFPQAFRELWTDERLLNVVEQLIGPDIMGHPVWNLRCKVPNNESTVVPWHQDAAYMDSRAYEVLQVTGWIPFLDATRENGCMEVVSGGHVRGKVATHTGCWKDTLFLMLDEEEMTQTLGVDMEKDVVCCPVPYGGILLLSNMLPHRSLPNVSNDIRWSIDLRWQRSDKDPGFFGLKDGIVMRRGDQPDLRVDWDPFMSVSRSQVEKHMMVQDAPKGEDARFDTQMQGPWMRQWEIVHHNRHTQALKAVPALS